jgi:glycosyltransferase 2 family protein
MKRRWLYYGLIFVFVSIVVSRFTEAEHLVKTLLSGNPRWVLVSLCIQAVYYVVFAAMFHAAMDTVEIQSNLFHLIPVWFTSVFMNITAPSAGMTGAAVFIDDAAHRGYPPARTTAAMVLVLAADYSAFALLLIGGLAYLFVTRNLWFYQVLASVILLLFIAGLSGILILGIVRPSALHRVLNWVQQLLARLAHTFKRKPWLRDDWAAHNAQEFGDAATAIRKYPGRLARTCGLAMLAHLLEMTTLYTLFQAFNVPVHLGVLVAGYSVGILFWLVAITPAGIGVVEGVMALVLTTLGVNGSEATVIAISFRGLTFWLPLIVGFALLRRSRSFGGARAS